MTHDTDIAPSISEQAAHWWVVFHSDGASAADHREFGEWVARSPERVEAYLRTARLQQALKSPRLKWPTVSAEELIRAARQSPQDAVQLPLANVTQMRTRRKPSTGMRFTLGLAAAVLLSVGAAWLTMGRAQQFQTRFGEQRSFLLEDGSRVTLNTASKIEVRLRDDRRLVHLVQGEALFDVAHDPSRPFEVKADEAVFRAVGTQFDVYTKPEQTTVTVVEGVVAVVSGSGPSGRGVHLPTLTASDRLVITPAGAGTPQHGTNVAAVIAWTQRQLIFEHRPLSEVADEFNRYNRERIEVEGEALRSQEVTGVFQSNDAASFVAFLSSLPGVRIHTDANGSHIVSADDMPPAGK